MFQINGNLDLCINHLRVGRNTVSFRQTLAKDSYLLSNYERNQFLFVKQFPLDQRRARCLMMIGPFLTWAPHPIIQVMIVGLGLVSYVADVGFDTEGMVDWLTMTGCHR